MFRSPLFRSGTIISDEGFTVQFIPPYAIQYQEGELEIDVTCDAVRPHLDLLHGSASAFRAGQFVHLNSSEDCRMFENITSALEWKGYIVNLVT